MPATETFTAEPVKNPVKCNRNGPLRRKEVNFLKFYLSGDHNTDTAMISAGYGNLSQDGRWRLARKIIKKYESDTEDKAIIMREMGVGETALISILFQIAQKSRSEGAKVAACTTLGKWLGLGNENIQGSQGITVIIRAPDHHPGADLLPSRPAGLPAPPTETRHPKPSSPGKPIQITK